MFGDGFDSSHDPHKFSGGWRTYWPSSIQWEVAKQMNHDWNRLHNQELTIRDLQSTNRDLRANLSETTK